MMKGNRSMLNLGLATLTAVVLMGAGASAAYAGTDDEGMIREAWTHTKVRLALLENVGTDALRIDIDVDGNDVTLSGTVRERTTVELAKKFTASVDGVGNVDTKLEIAEDNDNGAMSEVATELSDALLETKVKAALMKELGSKSFGIDVATADGVVVLSGEVKDDHRRDLAVTTAKGVKGVKNVKNLLDSKKS